MDKKATLYFDNAATSFPKPPAVAEAMADYVRRVGANVNRGGYAAAYAAEEVVLATRRQVARLFNWPEPRSVIFTANVTASLNILLKGLLRPGDQVLVSPLEHNAVLRPLAQLEKIGVTWQVLPALIDGRADMAGLPRLATPSLRAVVMTHASNVCGAVQDIEAAGRFCRERGVFFILDAAQTGGVYPVDMQAMNLHGLAFTGHKGLLGPQGLGGFILSPDLAAAMEPLLAGGTGSFSHSLAMPEALPDRFEPGTPNLPGVFGLHAALEFLTDYGLEQVARREQYLDAEMRRYLQGRPGLRLVGAETGPRVPALSVDFPGQDNAEVAFRLEQNFGLLTRCGLHCAPLAHQTLGAFPAGTVRLAPGLFTTDDELAQAMEAVVRVARG